MLVCTGPPYVVPEAVFDEITIGSCYCSEKADVLEAMADEFLFLAT